MSMDVHEHQERAERAAEAGDALINGVSITIAALAVAAAVTNSLEAYEAGLAITDSSRSVLAQNQASDAWAYYQAKSVKKHIYSLAADEGFPNADKFKKTAAKEAADGDEVSKQAKAFEEKRNEFVESSERHETRHHRLTAAAALLETGIAIATIAIITRKRWWWLASACLGVAGVTFAAGAYLGYGLF